MARHFVHSCMLVMYSVIQTFTFFKYDWSRLDIIDVCGGKKVGGLGGEREREKDNRIKNFYNINYSYHRASDRSLKKSQISLDFQRQIHRKNG